MPFRYPLETQDADKLCWAAIATSVAHYFDLNSLVTQCSVASSVLGRSCCSLDGIPNACNQVEYLENALDAVQRREPPTTAAALAFTEIVDFINRRMPVCVRIQWPNNAGGHFVAICGYRLTAEGNQYVEVSDPWYEDSILPYDDFLQNYQAYGRPGGGGSWSHTYRVRR